MSRETARNSLIISAAMTFVAATAYGAEPTERFERAAVQAELAPLTGDALARAAQIGRELAGRAVAITHCLTLQPQPRLAAARRAQADRS